MKINRKDIIVCGFALFAIFFGAGNMIFPPYLGVMSGDRWFTAAAGFILSDPVLPILGVIVTARLGGRAIDLGKRVGWKFSAIISAICILIIGPFFAVPRTGATTHEIFVAPNLPGVPTLVTSIVFFGLTLYLVFNPKKVLDYIGQILTPGLLIVLAVITAVAIVNPPAAAIPCDVPELFKMSFKEGYQTMDALGAALMSGIVLTDLIRRGYVDDKIQVKASIQIGLVAFICLALVYGSLVYVGSTVSSLFTPDMDRTAILLGTVDTLLGSVGRFILGLGVALACLTTSTGLISTCGNFFEDVTGGKLPYKPVVIVATAIAFAIMVVNSGANLEGDIFHAVFAVCIVSSLIQGSLLPWVVKKTDMLNPDDTVLKTFNYYQDRSPIGFLETKVFDEDLIGLPVKDLNLTFDFIVAKLVRDGKTIVPHGETILEKGDIVVIGGKSHFDEVGRNLQEFTIREHHPWASKRIMDLDLKPSELILMLERDNNILVPSGQTVVCVGDKIVYTEDHHELFERRERRRRR